LLVWADTWWLVGVWIALLFALIGGNVPGMRALRPRIAPLVAALYLLTALLMWVVPNLFHPVATDSFLALVVRYGLPVPLVMIMALPGDPRDQSAQGIDPVSTVLLFLMVIVLTLGALFVQQVTANVYPIALAQTVMGLAAVLVLLSWLWDPRGGYAGFGQLVSRYFLSLGVPFEQWMHSLADLAGREGDPQLFMALAAERMLELPWLSQVEWSSRSGTHGSSGVATQHQTSFELRGLKLRLHTKWRPGPALLLHMHLLARLLGDYHDMKVRERAQRDSAYLQAIYETGSRVTHDVKNLLQSLRSLCAAVESDVGADDAALRQLIQRQLPQMAQRLQNTLEKLEARPQSSVADVVAVDWLRLLAQRYAHEDIRFTAESLDETVKLPAELFDSVAENLLQNALEKRRLGPIGTIALLLDRDAAGFCRLSVRDDGPAVPESVASRLFSGPVASESGLGVGLYQVSRQAVAAGHELTLVDNRDGDVRFVLARGAG
jgi:signal transduction histidine kinase